jgi:hypothetical protein
VIPWRETGEATELRTVARERAVRVRAGGEAGWVRLDEVVGIARRETPRGMPLPDAPEPPDSLPIRRAGGGTVTLGDVRRSLRG